MSTLPRGTVTFLLSDIEGSTRRWAEDPEMASGLALHDELTRAAIEEVSGHWVKHTGDGVLAAFSDPRDAVAAAAGVQRRFAAAGWPSTPLRVRVGIHTGTAVERGGDYHGLAVSATARVADAGHGGQVLVSAASAMLLGALPDGLELIDLGPHRLKDLEAAQNLHQLAGAGLLKEFPPLRTLERFEHNLPLQLTSFVGREKELAEVRALVDGHRLVTLTGVGGVGKTRLSLQVAADMAAEFRDGVRFVELAPISDPGAVASAFASSLDIMFEKGSSVDVAQRVIDHLLERRILIVLDNCEHVLERVAAIAGRLLASAPEVRILASSRESLGLGGERIWQIPSLDVSGDTGDSEAVLLFLERAHSVAPTLELNEETRPWIETICRLLDGVPLAIELAAARARVLSPEQIAGRLSDRFKLLTGGSRSALPRQQTLEAAVDWSYQLLGDAEQQLFDRLSVFQGGFTLGAAEGVCSDDRLGQADILDLLSALVEKSMVLVHEKGSGVSRFGMLETLRQFAARKLMDRGETGSWKDRHAEWFAEFAAGMDHYWDPTGNVPSLVRAEAENLAAALEWCSDTQTLVVPLSEAIARHHLRLGDLDAAVAVATRGLTNEAITARERAHLLACKGRAEAAAGLEGATASLEDAAAVLDDSVGTRAAVLTLLSISSTFSLFLDAGVGVEMAERAIMLSEGADPAVRAFAHHGMGWAQVWAGAHPGAVLDPATKAIEYAREAGDPGLELAVADALLLGTMAMDYLDGGDRIRLVEDRLLSLEGPRESISWGLEWVGIRRAEWSLVESALAVGEAFGSFRIHWLVARGTMLWMRGMLTEAIAAFEEGSSLGSPSRWHHDFYPGWAEATCLTGDLAATRRIVDVHVGFGVRPDEQAMKLATMRALVQAEVDAGDLGEATALVERMRAVLAAHPLRMGAIVQLGTPEGYLACAEAELTRLSGPDPGAWAKARSMTVWEYWRSYCDARRVEAMLALEEAASAEFAAVRQRAEEFDFGWIVALLDSLEAGRE